MKNTLEQFNRSLYDLSKEDPKFQGIFSPSYTQEEVSRFMTSHYDTMQGAETQASDFDLTKFYYGLISTALKKAGIKKGSQNWRILDVGCGFGSTTFPLMKLFPKSQIIASELSLPMLFVLKQKLLHSKNTDQVMLLQLDAEDLDFKENSFDLIVGAAILHHLFEPHKTLKNCVKILKPGGTAIFFEPFQEGTSLMGLIYDRIIHDSRFKWLDFSLKVYFRHSVWLWGKMKNKNKNSEFFKKLDDKWLFERVYFREYAQKYGFTNLEIYRHDQSSQPFMNLFKNHLAKKIHTIPKWIFETIESYENWLTKEQKDELITEGCVIFKK